MFQGVFVFKYTMKIKEQTRYRLLKAQLRGCR